MTVIRPLFSLETWKDGRSRMGVDQMILVRGALCTLFYVGDITHVRGRKVRIRPTLNVLTPMYGGSLLLRNHKEIQWVPARISCESGIGTLP